MKVKKIEVYEPRYPKKKNCAALGAAALVLLSVSSAACRPQLGGAPMLEPTPEPTEQVAELMGDVAIETTELPALQGVVVADPNLPECTPGCEDGQ